MPIIAFEGIKGCGKTTLINFLDSYMRGTGGLIPHNINNEVPLTNVIRKHLSNYYERLDYKTRFLLLMAIRNQLSNFIKRANSKGTLVILDRYRISTLVYNTIECVGTLTVEETNLVSNFASTNIPDYYVVVKCHLEVAKNRLSKREPKNFDCMDNGDYVNHMVADKFNSYKDGDLFDHGISNCLKPSSRIITIDGNANEDEVFDELIQKLYKIGYVKKIANR